MRIQQAAYLLPQVVKPADYLDESAPHFEQHLDNLGLILLQRAAAGARPSRWIAPEHIAAALSHLAALGTGPQARGLMLTRTGQLEAMGISRAAGVFDRLLQHTLALSGTPGAAWQIRVAWRMPVPAEAVWEFHRTGDLEAFERALGPAPPYPHAEALAAHLEALVARAASGNPRRLRSQPVDPLFGPCLR